MSLKLILGKNKKTQTVKYHQDLNSNKTNNSL